MNVSNDKKRLLNVSQLNIVLSIFGWSLAAMFLWLGSHAPNVGILIIACVGFGLVNNTVFSLLHESVHGVFHENKTVNEWFGRISAAFFPTGFLVQRICHLGHHRRNRTDIELYDYCPKGVPMLLARFRLFCLLTGFFWSSAPLGSILYVLGVFRLKFFREKVAEFYGMRPMVEDVCAAPAVPVYLDILFTIAIQTALIILLDLTLLGWFACYWSFALLWCSVQYSTHAWTPRDVRNGAWNLTTSKLTDLVFLNYHYHLVHHQNPVARWVDLPRLAASNMSGHSWMKIYLSLWKGPRYTNEPSPVEISNEAL